MISADQYSDKRVLSKSHKKLLGETIKSCDDMIIVTRGVHANNFECFHNPLLITERSFKYEVMFLHAAILKTLSCSTLASDCVVIFVVH